MFKYFKFFLIQIKKFNKDFSNEFAVGENRQNKVEVYHTNEINNDLNNMETNIAELIKKKISTKKNNWFSILNLKNL